jgi:NAD(P)H dehydrogenase (quinone)
LTIAVTAASGRLGTALLRELAAAGPPGGLVAVARDPSRLALPAPGLVARAGDYESVASMTAALAGADTVVMISAPVAGGSDRERLHRNVIAAARAAGARTVVYTSVVGNGREAGTLFEPTQRVNRQAEADLRDSGLGWVVLRNGLYLELDLAHIIAADAEGGVYTNPGGDGRAPYVTIDEIAVATAAVARRARALEGRTLNVVAQCHTQAELVAMANEVFGLRVRYETISDEACIAKFSRLMAHRGEAVARMLTGCFQCIRAGAFDVPSDFAEAAGRPPRSVRQMMEDVKRRRAAAGA